jgi:5-methylcytosine-specific restriction protein A
MTGRELHKEWVGKRPTSMPGAIVRLRICEAQDNKCACGCGHVFDYSVDQIDVDHKLALKDGGENRESNLQGLLRQHHVTKTNAEATARGVANRHKAKAFAHQNKPSFATNRNGRMKKCMDGTVVLRATGQPVKSQRHEDTQ